MRPAVLFLAASALYGQDTREIVRESAGKAELVLPIKLDGGKARVVEEYAW